MGAAPAAVLVKLPYRKHEANMRTRLHLVRLFHSIQSAALVYRAPRYFEVDAAEAAIAHHSKDLEQPELRRMVLGLFKQTKRKPAEEAWQYFIGHIGAGFHRCDACALHSACPSSIVTCACHKLTKRVHRFCTASNAAIRASRQKYKLRACRDGGRNDVGQLCLLAALLEDSWDVRVSGLALAAISGLLLFQEEDAAWAAANHKTAAVGHPQAQAALQELREREQERNQFALAAAPRLLAALQRPEVLEVTHPRGFGQRTRAGSTRIICSIMVASCFTDAETNQAGLYAWCIPIFDGSSTTVTMLSSSLKS